MSLHRAALLLVLLSTTLRAQESTQREVNGGTLLSRADPAASFEVDRAFRYVGGQTIDILNVAGAEQYFFIDAAPDRSIRRFYWLQFEHYHPSNAFTYNYSRLNLHPVPIGPMAFLGDVRVIPQYFTNDSRPGSDSKAGADFLLARGLSLGGTFVTLRLFHLPDSTRRRELMVIYGEVFPVGASEPQARAEITAHAQANLRVRGYGGASGN